MLPRPTRLIFIFLAAFLFLSGFFYLKYRPPYEVYKALKVVELEESKKWVQQQTSTGSDKRKFVVFKQLQGAGFNNQVLNWR